MHKIQTPNLCILRIDKLFFICYNLDWSVNMNKFFAAAALFFLLFSLGAEEFITVYKDGNDFFVRSRFSESEDLVIQNFRYANEIAYLIGRDAPLSSYQKGKILHASGDDYPAVAPLGGYGTLSGNHGSIYTRLLSVALGNSLFMDKTAKKNMPGDREMLYHLCKSHKMYPISGTPKNIRAGQTEEVVAYHQYFNAQLEPDATSFYCHYQGKSLMVYLDFHKELKNKTVKLPRSAAGKKITILEKTPALTLHTPAEVPAAGITLSNNATHGYLVLKLD